jgi:hypothetical protein
MHRSTFFAAAAGTKKKPDSFFCCLADDTNTLKKSKSLGEGLSALTYKFVLRHQATERL